MSSFVPAIPAIQDTFAVSGNVAQLTLSVSIITMAFTALLYGPLADRWGRRPVLLCGLAIAVLGSLVCASATNVMTVIVGRALQAAGTSSGFILARVLIRDVYGDARSASVLAYVTAAMTLAPMAGPVIGGILLDSLGWRSVFVSIGGAALGLLAVAMVRLPETGTQGPVEAGPIGRGAISTLLRDPSYLRNLTYGSFAQAAFFAFIAGAPFFMTRTLGYSASAYGAYFTIVPVGYFVGSLIAGRLGTRWSHEQLTSWGAWGGLVSSAAGLLFWILSNPGPLALFLPCAGLALASGMAMPAAQAGMLAASGRHSGTGSGLFGCIQLLVAAAAAQWVGNIQNAGAVGIFSMMVGLSILALVGLLIFRAKPPQG